MAVSMIYKSHTVLLLICNGLSFIQFSQSQPTPQDTWPFSNSVPFPFRTLCPININSSEARPVKVPPLHFFVPNLAYSLLENFDYGVRLSSLSKEPGCLTGGVLLNDKYIFHEHSFTWDGIDTGRASDEIDNVGTPLQTQFVYYNSKYQTFENALKFRNGIAIFILNVIVEGVIANPSFTPFQNALNKVVLCGSRTVSPVSINNQWTVGAMHSPTYYSYPGAYIDYRTNRQFESATIIFIPSDCWPTISKSQFQTFTNLQNSFRQPIANALPLRCSLQRPIVQAQGTIVTFVL